MNYKDIKELRAIAKENEIKNSARKSEETLIKDLEALGLFFKREILEGDVKDFITETTIQVTNEISVCGGSTPGNDKLPHELIKEAQIANSTSNAAMVAELARITARVIARKNGNKQVIKDIYKTK